MRIPHAAHRGRAAHSSTLSDGNSLVWHRSAESGSPSIRDFSRQGPVRIEKTPAENARIYTLPRHSPPRTQPTCPNLLRDIPDQPVHVAGRFHMGHMAGIGEAMDLHIAGKAFGMLGGNNAVLAAGDDLQRR